MKATFLILVLFAFASCQSLKEPLEIISYDGSQMEQFSGQLVKLKAGFHVQNKLWVPVKMKPGSFELFIDQQKIGSLYLDEPIKLRALRENQIVLPLRIVPEPGFITTAYKAAKKPKILVKISGYPKAGVFFLYKTFPVSKETEIEPSQFIPSFPTF